MKNTAPYVLIAVVSMIAAACAYLALINFYRAYMLERALNSQMSSARALLSQTTFLRYATVESVDSANQTLSLQALNAYREGMIRLTLQVSDQTLILSQRLIDAQGVYSSLSEATPYSFANIRPGDRIAYLAREGQAANVIIVGDPL